MTPFFTIVFFCLGAIIASFVGVLVERINTACSWITGRSQCDSCAQTLSPLDLVPLISWSLTLGHCRMCGSRVSWHAPLTELVLGVLFAASYLKIGLSYSLFAFLCMLGALLAVVLYDLRHMFVPRAFFLVFTASAVLVACLSADSLQNLGLVFLVASAIGLAFFLLFVLSGGRAMGLGDAPIALGLALGAGARALAGLIFSFWIGALIGIALLVVVPRARRMGVEVPFVPFLAGGFLLAYFTTWDPFLIIAALFGT